MNFDTGTIIAVAAALLFYLRLIILQRHRANQGGQRGQAGLRIVSWYLLGLGIVLILVGALMTALSLFTPEIRALWWAPLTLGILVLGLSIR